MRGVEKLRTPALGACGEYPLAARRPRAPKRRVQQLQHAGPAAGGHGIVVGQVRELVLHREAAPLVFYRGTFGLDL